MVDLAGIGFRTADRIARKLGVREDSILRTQAGLLYLFDRAQRSDGSCYLTRTEMEEALAQLLGERPETLEEALFDLIVQGKLVEDPEKNRWYLRIIDEEERNVAMRVVTLLGEKSAPLAADMEEIERSIGIRLDETQRDAVVRAATEPVLVLTGGPGTGKTTIVRAILELFDQNQLSTELAAPTGRAAKRLEQSTTRSALTLHRLLGYRGGEEAAHHPSMNEDNPLAADAVIVDEVSMVDLELFSNLCAALPDGCRLILVGDADQLPSVGAGNVLHDLIASDVVPVVRLDHIYRQAERSMIVVNAHRIRNGMDPILNEPGGDFFFLSADGSRDAADLIEDLVVRRLPEHYGFVPKRDIRVLSAMKKGECGVENLNLRLQQALNPPHPERKEYMVGQVLFREGDSVMQVKNDYDLEWNDLSDPDEEQKGEGVYNGDFGVLTAVDPEGEFMEASFDGRVAHYLPLQFKELSHSFAITIHKSQGSEFPCVVIAVVPGAPLLETRNIIYTAMTRARKLCVLVGDVATLHRMVSHHRMERRNSSLNERLIAAAALQHEMGF